MALYDPNQSLPMNLQMAGFTPEQGTMSQGLNPTFLSAIQTAMAKAGMPGYGGQQAFDLISRADPNMAQADPIGYANQLLGQSGIQGFSNPQELNAANNALPGHSTGLFDLKDTFNQFKDMATGDFGQNMLRMAAVAAGGQAIGGGLGGTAGGAAAGGTGSLMPAAIPESAATLSNWGLTQTAPGVFAAAAPAGVSGAAAAPVAGGGSTAAPAAGGAAAATGLGGGLTSLLSSPTALGIGAGALLGGMGGSQQAGTVTTEEGIPDWLQPYIKPQLDKYSTDLQNYQIDPYGVMPSAMKQFQDTISGQFLDPSTNKYLEDYFKLGAERVKGSLSPSFGHMQAFGQHSGYNEALSRGLGDFATGLYGGAYEKERDRQSQMTAAAPAFIGQSSQAAFQPYQQYLNTVGSLGKKKDQPFFENPFGNILGGAMVGGTLGSIWK